MIKPYAYPFDRTMWGQKFVPNPKFPSDLAWFYSYLVLQSITFTTYGWSSFNASERSSLKALSSGNYSLQDCTHVRTFCHSLRWCVVTPILLHRYTFRDSLTKPLVNLQDVVSWTWSVDFIKRISSVSSCVQINKNFLIRLPWVAHLSPESIKYSSFWELLYV